MPDIERSTLAVGSGCRDPIEPAVEPRQGWGTTDHLEYGVAQPPALRCLQICWTQAVRVRLRPQYRWCAPVCGQGGRLAGRFPETVGVAPYEAQRVAMNASQPHTVNLYEPISMSQLEPALVQGAKIAAAIRGRQSRGTVMMGIQEVDKERHLLMCARLGYQIHTFRSQNDCRLDHGCSLTSACPLHGQFEIDDENNIVRRARDVVQAADAIAQECTPISPAVSLP